MRIEQSGKTDENYSQINQILLEKQKFAHIFQAATSGPSCCLRAAAGAGVSRSDCAELSSAPPPEGGDRIALDLAR